MMCDAALCGRFHLAGLFAGPGSYIELQLQPIRQTMTTRLAGHHKFYKLAPVGRNGEGQQQGQVRKI